MVASQITMWLVLPFFCSAEIKKKKHCQRNSSLKLGPGSGNWFVYFHVCKILGKLITLFPWPKSPHSPLREWKYLNKTYIIDLKRFRLKLRWENYLPVCSHEGALSTSVIRSCDMTRRTPAFTPNMWYQKRTHSPDESVCWELRMRALSPWLRGALVVTRAYIPKMFGRDKINDKLLQ